MSPGMRDLRLGPVGWGILSGLCLCREEAKTGPGRPGTCQPSTCSFTSTAASILKYELAFAETEGSQRTEGRT